MRSIEFSIEHKISTQHLFDLLTKAYSCNKTHLRRIQRQYLDSFDWRLYQKSYICGIEEANVVKKFFLSENKAGGGICLFPLDEVPNFPKDITHTKCRLLLERILELRALVHVVTVQVRQKQLHVVDNEGKTQIKLYVERYTIPDHPNLPLIQGRLIVFPIRGYEKLFRDVMQYTESKLKLVRAETNVLNEVLTIIGKLPNPSDLEVTKELSDSLSTWEATQILLRDLLKVMLANEKGLRGAIDTEFLHDYRVAIRRIRSLLVEIRHLFFDKEFEYFKQEFCWLGLITSPTRDLDVYLLKFSSYIKVLPQKMRDDLAPFYKFLCLHWEAEHTLLRDALDSKRYCKLIRELKRVLKRKRVQSPQAFNAEKPVKQVASQRILRLYKKVLVEGKAITAASPDDDLHELRKTCKKLRYLLDFFQGYYASSQIERLIKNLKLLQDHLGNFHDLCIQIHQLSDFAQQMQNEGIADTKTIMAMGVLVQNLVVQKDALRTHFNGRFKVFSAKEKIMQFKMALSYEELLKGVSV